MIFRIAILSDYHCHIGIACQNNINDCMRMCFLKYKYIKRIIQQDTFPTNTSSHRLHIANNVTVVT